MIWMLLALVPVGGLAWLAFGIWQINRVSKGAPIPNRPGTALLMIDLQSVFWDDGPYAAAEKARVEATIEKEVTAARAANHPVIAIRQEWSQPAPKAVARLLMGGAALPGSKGTEIVPRFAAQANHTLTKRVQDAFETNALDDLLNSLNVGKLRLVGLDGAYCVARTAEAALQRGYSVTLVQDGIATAKPQAFETQVQKLQGQGAQLA